MFKKILSLVLTLTIILSVMTFPSFAAATGEVELYPEYPDIINRDYDYQVTVSDGVNTYEIPVYNAARNKDSFDGRKNTDSWRRFCEFSFTGEVKVTVTTKLRFEKVSVMPSEKQIPFTVNNNQISFTLTNPTDVVVRLNDDHNTILSIFAEAPVEEFVSETANVLYFDAGLNNFNRQKSTANLPNQNTGMGYGSVRVPANTTVYLAPGAVVTLRFYARGDNTSFVGRGAILDPHTQRGANYNLIQVQHQPVHNDVVNNVKIKDIRLLDAHTFNITLLGVDGVEISGIKMLSSEISTDGISTYGTNITVEDSFIYTSDDTFVIGTNTGLTVKNCTIASSGSFTHVHTHNSYGEVVFENVNAFRMGDFFRNVEGTKNHLQDKSDYKITFKNVNTVDTLHAGTLARVQQQGDEGENGGKHIYLENVVLPAGRNQLFEATSGNINVYVKNLYIGNEKITSKSQLTTIPEYSAAGYMDNFIFNFLTADAFTPKTSVNTKTASYSGAPYVMVGGYQIPYDKGVVKTINGEKYIPVKNVLENLGYTVSVLNNTITLTNSNGTITVCENKLNCYGVEFTITNGAVVENGAGYLPVSFLNTHLNLNATQNGDNVVISADYNGENLLKEGRFEDLHNPFYNNNSNSMPYLIDSTEWTHFNQSPIYVSTDAHSGLYSVSVATYNQTANGITQYLGDQIKKYGAGTYRFEAWVKKGSETITGRDGTFDGTLVDFGIVQSGYRIRVDGELIGINDVTTVTLTDSWQKITYDVIVTDPNADGYDRAFFYIGTAEDKNTNIIVDDAAVYFTKTVNNNAELTALLNSPAPTREGEIFKGWADKNGNILTASSNVSSSTAVYPEFIHVGNQMNGKVEEIPVLNVGGMDLLPDECRLGIHYNANGNGMEYNVIDSEGDMTVEANKNLVDGKIIIPKADTYFSQARYWDGTTNNDGGAWVKSFTAYPAPNGYTPKTVKLGYNTKEKIFAVPAEVTLYVGDTLVFSTGKQSNDPNPVCEDATYTNGMFLQGTQVRVGDSTVTGLRFITVNNVGFVETLKANFTNVSFGTVVIAQKDFNDFLLTVNTTKSKDVEAKKIFRSATGLQRWYQKYTACVTGIPVNHFKSNIVARPYIKYTDNSGVEHVLYGEQYSTNIYDVAVEAYDGNLEDNTTKNYLFNEIISKLGIDNDADIEF